jgi:6-pyruvoyltetrahydropterin/6-carboxytetrahydropterin synthase
MKNISAQRYHDFSCGHRVHGHESKCANLHGHNYRAHFCVEQYSGNKLDAIGRVVDFSVIKTALCDWLEQEWDHRFLLWVDDPMLSALRELDRTVVAVPFNPTAENMADHLLHVIGPMRLPIGLILTEVRIDETRKCSATARWRSYAE